MGQLTSMLQGLDRRREVPMSDMVSVVFDSFLGSLKHDVGMLPADVEARVVPPFTLTLRCEIEEAVNTQ